jgi:AcrR family transcriptional regulator
MPTALRQQRDRERKERTRRQLLDAAADVLADKGYHATLISDIVAAAGVGQGTFYRFFGGKRAVYDALLDGYFAELVAEFDEIGAAPLRDEREYRDASLAAVRRVAERVLRRPRLTLLLLRETASVDPGSAEKLSGLLDRFAAVAKAYLDQAIAKGHARPCNSTAVAHSLVGIGLYLLQRWFDGLFADLSLTELTEQVVDFAFRGIGAAKDQPS